MDARSDGQERQQREAERIRAAYEHRRSLARLYSAFEPAHLLMLHSRAFGVLRTLKRAGFSTLGDIEILDIGCGTGQWLHDLVGWGADPHRLHGIDLAEDRIAEARRRLPAAVDLAVGDASRLSFPAERFDLVVQGTVFSSVLDEMVQTAIAVEIVRVLRPGGFVLWYDLCVDNPRNREIKRVNKRRIQELFPDCSLALRRVTLLPPLGRLIAPRSAALYRCLEAWPFLCSHYLGLVRKDHGHASGSRSSFR